MLEHSKYELDLILDSCEDEEEKRMQKSINDHILEMIKIFSDYGHSGFTAGYTINILTKLLKFENLTPLKLTDDEFVEVSDGVFQNKRNSKIFKQADRFNGKPYNVDTMKEYSEKE